MSLYSGVGMPSSVGSWDSMGGTSRRAGGYDFAGSSSQPPPPAITTTATKKKQDEKRDSRETRATTSTTESLNTILNTGQTNNMSPEALASLNDIVSGRDIDRTVALKDQAAQGNITQLQQLLSSLNPMQAEQRASGRVADLGRTLMEQVLPQLFGGAEMQGTGGNLAANLLAQDAAIRTGEAQNRAVEEARGVTINQQLQGSEILNALTSGTSSANEVLMKALGISKGAVENKSSATTSQTGTNVNESSVATETGTAEQIGSTDTTQELTDPLGWAKLAAAEGVGGDRPGDRALATFIAAGGDVGALSSTWDDGMGDYNRKMLQSIQSMMGA